MQRVHFPGVDTYTEFHSSEDSLGRAGIHAKLPSTLNPLMHSPGEILEGWRRSAFHPSVSAGASSNALWEFLGESAVTVWRRGKTLLLISEVSLVTLHSLSNPQTRASVRTLGPWLPV